VAKITVVREVNAPRDVVFQTVADPRRFAHAIEGVTEVAFLSKETSGEGTRFRQTRVMNGKATAMEFEVREAVPNERVRIVNETHGTVWDSLFTFASSEGTAASTVLTMRMDTTTRPLFQRLLMPLFCLLVRKSVEEDIDAVKAFSERWSAAEAAISSHH
jgi:carbon monoxide dehydrogenase subunit G